MNEVSIEEVAKFLKEFDEGKHPLSQKDLDALGTAGFRQYLKASIELTRLRVELEVSKQRVNELEELQLLDVHAICDQRDDYRAECDRLRAENEELMTVLRYLFYMRLPLGEKVEEFLAQDQPDKWQEIFALLADKAAMQTEKEKQ
jgi:hypothetical protein